MEQTRMSVIRKIDGKELLHFAAIGGITTVGDKLLRADLRRRADVLLSDLRKEHCNGHQTLGDGRGNAGTAAPLPERAFKYETREQAKRARRAARAAGRRA